MASFVIDICCIFSWLTLDVSLSYSNISPILSYKAMFLSLTFAALSNPTPPPRRLIVPLLICAELLKIILVKCPSLVRVCFVLPVDNLLLYKNSTFVHLIHLLNDFFVSSQFITTFLKLLLILVQFSKINGNVLFWIPQELCILQLLLILCVCQQHTLLLEMVRNLFLWLVCEVKQFVLDFLEPWPVLGFEYFPLPCVLNFKINFVFILSKLPCRLFLCFC